MTTGAMQVKVDKSAYEMFATLDNVSLKTAVSIRQGWYTVGGILKKTLVEDIKHKPKSGRVYRIRRGSRMYRHRASAPAPAGQHGIGETPANMRGGLRKSIGYQVRGWEEMEFGSQQGERAVPYARALDKGFEARNLKPRPFIQNTYRTHQGTIVSVFENAIKASLVKRGLR